MEQDDFDLDQVIGLVELLYSSRDPDQVIEVQKILQRFQKSSNSWYISNQLLLNDSINCKFFGALTYTVGINLHLGEFSTDLKFKIILELLNHVILLINENKNNTLFVIEKLLSNLAIIFVTSYKEWSYSLQSLYASLKNKNPQIINDSNINDFDSTYDMILLLFSQIVVEETSKLESSNVDKSNLHKFIHEKFFPITSALLFRTEMIKSLDCLGSWIQYISTAELESVERYDLSIILDHLLDLIILNNADISQRAINVTVDILDTNPSMLNKVLKNKLDSLIFGKWGVNYLQSLIEDHDFENINQFSRLVILFLETDIIHVAHLLADDANNEKFEFLLNLTNFPGIPIDEELISKDFIEFWSELAEAYVDDEDRLLVLLKNDTDQLMKLNQKATSIFQRVSSIYWSKIHIPVNVDDEEFKLYKEEFMSYRSDVADFFDTIYPIVKIAMYKNLIDTISNNISSAKPNFQDIEASLFLINSISSNFNEDNINTNILSYLTNILESNFFEIISSNNSNENKYTISTTIQFLSSIDFFYKHKIGLKYLPSILNFLFSCMLESNLYHLSSSKAICRISNDCRLSLVGYLPNFENLIVEMINNINILPIIRERIVNSYASIIQGIKNPEIQGKNLNILLGLINEKCVQLITNNQITNENTLNYLISLLNCIYEIGKGMQLPEDDVEDFYSQEEINLINEYWTNDSYNIHDKIIRIITEVSTNSSSPMLLNNTEIVEKCCLIFKTGLTESIEGPFVFKDETLIQYILTKSGSANINTMPFLFELFDAVITANYKTISPSLVSSTVDTIFLSRLPLIKTDPDLIESSIKILGTIVEKKPSLIIYNGNFTIIILHFCLENLSTSEKFILKSVSKFWSKLIVLKKGDKRDFEFISNLFLQEKLGVVLTYAVISNLLKSQRSNIDNFQEILKFLIVKYPLYVKNWLEDAFAKVNEERVNQRIDELKSYHVFIKKLIMTRGKTQAFQNVVKEYWLETNGLFNY
ncbi:hypothetical protein PACTADRAFT_51947 [Pachysolen tannophilus NRRL Y-2460]|uniref:Importin N-terminal domain-containing protein n=1 Tax=Pachysolen tannophilus NRRL Y-2460 TaxID=669874 RepID=A0A1E4TNK1_PACTA|nr:hypothetical protein PACTADRAFT_51947 [Pachysolen tannophilus NRRL Y-2460]